MRSFIAANLFAILWAAWRRRYLIAVPIALMPVVGLVIGLVSPQKYESYTTILIQEAAKQNPFLEDLTVAINFGQRMEALNALLHSRHVLGDVVQALYPSDRARPPNDEMDRLVAHLSRSLKATLLGDDLVQIRYFSDDPDGMTDVLRLVSERFNERIVAPQRSSIRNSEAFLKQELEKRRVDLEDAERGLAAYKTNFASELPEFHAANVARLTELQQTLAERRMQLEAARAARRSLSARLARTDPVVGRIEEEIVAAMNELAGLRTRYTDAHSKVRVMLRRLERFEEHKRLSVTVHPSSTGLDHSFRESRCEPHLPVVLLPALSITVMVLAPANSVPSKSAPLTVSST